MKSSGGKVVDLQQVTHRGEVVRQCEGVLHHSEAQVKKYNRFGFAAAKLSFPPMKRFTTTKEKARCNEEQNENKMKPQVCYNKATLRHSEHTLRCSEGSIYQRITCGFAMAKKPSPQ